MMSEFEQKIAELELPFDVTFSNDGNGGDFTIKITNNKYWYSIKDCMKMIAIKELICSLGFVKWFEKE